MEYRLTTIEDYPELVTWWKWFRFPAPSVGMLPNKMKDGIIISQNGENICAAFLYRTPSEFCFIEYTVSNPAIKDKKIRREALILLNNTISSLGTKMGFKLMFTFVKNENLINVNLDSGFVKGSSSVEMIKKL